MPRVTYSQNEFETPVNDNKDEKGLADMAGKRL